jgi:uridine phosphorylase
LKPVLGNLVQRTAKLDKRLARDLKSMAEPSQLFDTVTGKTMCTYDFYEGRKGFFFYF